MEKEIDLVTYILKSLVNKPEEVKVTASDEKEANVIEVRVAEEDYGRVIGKRGRIINALRTLLIAFYNSPGKRWILNVPSKKD